MSGDLRPLLAAADAAAQGGREAGELHDDASSERGDVLVCGNALRELIERSPQVETVRVPSSRRENADHAPRSRDEDWTETDWARFEIERVHIWVSVPGRKHLVRTDTTALLRIGYRSGTTVEVAQDLDSVIPGGGAGHVVYAECSRAGNGKNDYPLMWPVDDRTVIALAQELPAAVEMKLAAIRKDREGLARGMARIAQLGQAASHAAIE